MPSVLDTVSDPETAARKRQLYGGSIATSDPRNQWPIAGAGSATAVEEEEEDSTVRAKTYLDQSLGHGPGVVGTHDPSDARIGEPYGYNNITDIFNDGIRAIGKMLLPGPLGLLVDPVQNLAARSNMSFSSDFSIPEAATTAGLFGRDKMQSWQVEHNLRSKGQDVNVNNAMTEIANLVAAQHSGIAEPTPDRSRTGSANRAAAEAMMASTKSAVPASKTSRGRSPASGRGPGGPTGSAPAAGPSAAASPYGGGDYGGT